MVAPDTVLILGCGTIGARVAGLVRASGQTVLGIRRTPMASPADCVAGDISATATWQSLPDQLRSRGGTWPPRRVLLCANPGLRRGHDNGLAQAAALARQHLPTARLVYTGTTAVYADAAGGGVDEQAPLISAAGAPAGLLAIEAAVLGQAGALVLRLPALVGPSRRHALQRLQDGINTVAGDLDRPFSFVHELDLAEIAVAALAGAYGGGILNVASPERSSLRDYYAVLARRAGVAPPHGDGQRLPSRWIDATRFWRMEPQRRWRSFSDEAPQPAAV